MHIKKKKKPQRPVVPLKSCKGFRQQVQADCSALDQA